jgi:hypothetical protein
VIDDDPSGATAGAHRIVISGEVRLDPSVAAAGRRLPPGRWDVTVRVTGLGLSRMTRLRPAEGTARIAATPALSGTPPRVVTPQLPRRRQGLSFVVARPGPPLVRHLARSSIRLVEATKRRLVLAVDVHSASTSGPVRGRVLVLRDGRRIRRLRGRISDGRLVVRTPDKPLPTGIIELRLRLRPKTKPVPLTSLTVQPGRRGRLDAEVIHGG